MQLTTEHRHEVEAHLRHLGWLQGGERLEALSVAGEGNMNRTLRAHAGASSFILKQAVPYVARYPEIEAPIERQHAELVFYRAIEGSNLALRTPDVLGHDPDNHLLALEDLGDAGDMLDAYRHPPIGGVNGGRITGLAYWLWQLHALEPPDPTLTNPQMRALNHTHIFVLPLDAGNGVPLTTALQAAAQVLRQDASAAARSAELGRIYLGEAGHASRPALLHGDFYPGSWIKHDALGVAVIDPEFAFVGPPEFDVGVLIAHLTFCGYSDAQLMDVLRSYVTPPGFDFGLATGFAAMEIIRRLIGVAQLPLSADDSVRAAWLARAHNMLTGAPV